MNATLERARLRQRGYELDQALTPERLAELAATRAEQDQIYQALQSKLTDLYGQIQRDSIRVKTADDKEITLPLAKLVRIYRPNQMSTLDKLMFYATKLGEFIGDDPREGEYGRRIFPAIYGTVLMVIIMSLFVTPMGVVAAIYLREYAHQGTLTRIIRIAVNNLAGSPRSFMVCLAWVSLSTSWERILMTLFPGSAASPTFGTPGLLWASITLALLTLPVVIVATEEGLARIPRAMREGSLRSVRPRWKLYGRWCCPWPAPR